jgi:hypothetical protein
VSALNHSKARYAALTRSRRDDDPVLIGAKRDLAEARIASYIQRILADAPTLNDEQRSRIADLLRPRDHLDDHDLVDSEQAGGDLDSTRQPSSAHENLVPAPRMTAQVSG